MLSITQNPGFHRSVRWSSKLTTIWVVLQSGRKNIQCSTMSTTQTNLNNFPGTLNVSNSGCWNENWQTIILQTRWLNNNSEQKEMETLSKLQEMTKINGKAPIFHLKLPLARIWEHCKKSAETIWYEL